MPTRTSIPFAEARSGAPSLATDPGPMHVTSAPLGWRGVHVECGRNDGFIADDVVVPHHYFAMILHQPLRWETRLGRGYRKIFSTPEEIWVNPAHVPFTNRVCAGSEFVLLTLEPATAATAVNGPGASAASCRQDFNARDPRLRAHILALAAEAEQGGPHGRLFVDSLVAVLSAHVERHYAGPSPAPADAHGALDPRRFRRALEFLEAHLTADVSLEALASEVALSRYHLIRRFKETAGVSPYRYVLERRLETGRAWLLEGRRSVADIAAALAFTDQSHFTRQFKRKFGITPAALRR